ncbi:universal stress protein [Sphingosinicella sp. YJ22]|uniref:universal stress protein n=1 Tax=Sphingosinicella sp. YJ22 TaxID=1104780 RepID=UPI00140E4B9D|nr:universal stress protein [Sphingosinicella sp. YJ22]
MSVEQRNAAGLEPALTLSSADRGAGLRSILLHVDGEEGQEARVEAALDLARAFEGHITCVQINPFRSGYVGVNALGGAVAIPEFIEEIEQAKAERRQRLEDRLRAEQVLWAWQEVTGDVAQSLIDLSRLTDVVVLNGPGEDPWSAVDALSLSGEVIVHARPPVLVMPARRRSLDCFGRALVAWNGSPESCNALKASLPMLRGASGVHIAIATREETAFPATLASEYLGWHGIKSDLREIELGTRELWEALLHEASQVGAAYIVMGGYGHSRFREAVLGGTTRAMLKLADLPLLIGH